MLAHPYWITGKNALKTGLLNLCANEIMEYFETFLFFINVKRFVNQVSKSPEAYLHQVSVRKPAYRIYVIFYKLRVFRQILFIPF
jgi:hypothetical protein